jgi:hypothetical protein
MQGQVCQLYVETTLALPSVNKQAAESRVDTVYDAINDKLESPNFFLAIRNPRGSIHSPSGRKLVADLSSGCARSILIRLEKYFVQRARCAPDV